MIGDQCPLCQHWDGNHSINCPHVGYSNKLPYDETIEARFTMKADDFKISNDSPLASSATLGAESNVRKLPVQKVFHTERQMAEEIQAVIMRYNGEISMVAAVGILETIKQNLIPKNSA